MIVIKKSGLKEDFSIGKLQHSIKAANNKTDEIIDLSELLEIFQQILDEKTQIKTQNIDIIVYGLLYSKGYMQTLINYKSYEKQ